LKKVTHKGLWEENISRRHPGKGKRAKVYIGGKEKSRLVRQWVEGWRRVKGCSGKKRAGNKGAKM